MTWNDFYKKWRKERNRALHWQDLIGGARGLLIGPLPWTSNLRVRSIEFDWSPSWRTDHPGQVPRVIL